MLSGFLIRLALQHILRERHERGALQARGLSKRVFESRQ